MNPARLTPTEFAVHLAEVTGEARRVVMAARRLVLGLVPSATEAIKFGVICYFHDRAYFKSIGGNICMLEIRRGRVVMSFIRGASLPDPAGLLYGTGRFKRFMDLPDVRSVRRRAVAEMIRAAADQETMGNPRERMPGNPEPSRLARTPITTRSCACAASPRGAAGNPRSARRGSTRVRRG
ncbi:MAG: DUF1801 domain-containing protein [Phycisphaerales bacterium]